MDRREILEKVIQKAIDNGWTDKGGITHNLNPKDVLTSVYCEHCLMLNHAFAKALWPDPEHYNENVPSWGDPIPYWKGRLKELVISDDPFKYLEEHAT